jgi:hypothetical protein
VGGGGAPAGAVRRGSVPFEAPAIPRYFVPRPEPSSRLRALVLAPPGDQPGTQSVIVVHGAGGIGKTTLVAALCHAPEVQARFPDGVLWATLGQSPEMLAHLQDWVQALHDFEYRSASADATAPHLRSLLHERACLLVVDDAWDADHVRPYLAGGPACSVIVTTRDAALARKLGALLYSLDAMTEAQALALFEGRVGRSNMEREVAAALAHRLGYLPLALELAAASFETGYGGREMLGCFEAAVPDLAFLDIDEASKRTDSLRICFDLSLNRLTSEDQSAFDWLGILPEDAGFGAAMAATLWDQPEQQALARIRRLRDKALLRPAGDDNYSVHDLLLDYARLRLALRTPLPEAHAALLARYLELTEKGQWHTLRDDGYIHRWLAWHLAQAGNFDGLHALLCEETSEGKNGWHTVRERMGQTAGYLSDLGRGAGAAMAADNLRLQIRYALMSASVRSFAEEFPASLMIAMLRYGSSLMSAREMLNQVSQKPEIWQRSDALHDLAPYLPAYLLPDALDLAIGLASSDNERGLLGLAPILSPDLLVDAFRRVPGRVSTWKQVLFLEAAAPTLPSDLLDLALALARQIDAPAPRAMALACLVGRLAGDQLGQVVGEAEAAHVEARGAPFRVLSYLAPTITTDRFDALCESWPDEDHQALIFSSSFALACLRQGRVGEYIAVCESLPWAREDLLELLRESLQYMPAERLADLLDCLAHHGGKFGHIMARALALVGQYGNGELQADALALIVALDIDGFDELPALAELLPHVRRPATRCAVEARVRELLFGISRCDSSGQILNWQLLPAHILPQIIDNLGDTLIAEILEWADHVAPNSYGIDLAIRALHCLAEPAARTKCQRLLAAARDGWLDPEQLLAMAQHAPAYMTEAERDEFFALALSRSRRINDEDSYDPLAPYRAALSGRWQPRPGSDYFREYDHVRVLLDMAPYAANPASAARLALGAMGALGSNTERYMLPNLAAIVHCLPANERQNLERLVLDRVADEVLSNDNSYFSPEIVETVKALMEAPGAQRDWLIGHMFAKAGGNSSERDRAILSALLMDWLPPSEREQCRADLATWYEGHTGLMDLFGGFGEGEEPLNRMARDLVHRALGIEEDAHYVGRQEIVIKDLASMTDALHGVASDPDYKRRPLFMIRYARAWAAFPTDQARAVMRVVLPWLAEGDRRRLLWDLHAIAAVIIRIGHEATLAAVIEEVERVRRWWP